MTELHRLGGSVQALEDIDRFIATGFGKDHALEVIAIVAASTITRTPGREPQD